MMNKELFNNIVVLFKKRYDILNKKNSDFLSTEELVEMLELGIDVEYKNPFSWMNDLFEINKNIICYFDSINEEWCKKYHNDRNNFPTESTPYPNIFLDFIKYVQKLNNEQYIECQEIKDKIFTFY